VPSSPRDRNHRIYEEPRLYDLAFSFRDVQAECAGLLALARDHGIAKPRSVVEVACGPGHHLRELARRGLTAAGVDTSRDMLAYAKGIAKEEDVDVRFVRADMRTYRLPARVDLALCLFDSFTHCTTDEDGIAALQATGRALRRGGLFIIEVTHPADYFDAADRRTMQAWTERFPDVVVRAHYDVSRRDAVAETYVATLRIGAKFRDGRKPRRIVSRQLHRMWLRSGLANVAQRSGLFDVAGLYGDLERRLPLTMNLPSWRMVAVLRRR
jgi:SAM-dependent methyltransferase